MSVSGISGSIIESMWDSMIEPYIPNPDSICLTVTTDKSSSIACTVRQLIALWDKSTSMVIWSDLQPPNNKMCNEFCEMIMLAF